MFFSLHDITYNPRLTCPFWLAPSEPISSSVLQANGGTDRQTDGQRYVNARDTKLLDAAVVIFNALYLSFLYIGAMAWCGAEDTAK